MATSIYTIERPASAASQTRTEALRLDLIARRRDLITEIRRTIEDARAEASVTFRPTADSDAAAAEPQDDLAFALLQMKSHTLNRINVAVQRIDQGSYGCCVDCAEAIAPARLYALPFAIRCRSCEDTRERSDRRQDTEVRWASVDPGFATH